MQGQDPQANGLKETTSSAFYKAQRAARCYFEAGQMDRFHETIALLSLRGVVGVSIVLVDPELPDSPIIGVSKGFRKLTGYTRAESLGQNCRFLNFGCPMKADTRHSLRIAVRKGKTHVCVLTNQRKFGEYFQNLFHMSSIRIGRKSYLVGIQADVTDIPDINLSSASHMAELNMLVDRIFAENVKAWIALQSRDFTMSRIGQPLPNTESMLKTQCEPDEDNDVFSGFVSLEGDLHQGADSFSTKNGFLETFDDSDSREALSLLRKVSSEPLLSSGRKCLGDDSDEEPHEALELHPYKPCKYVSSGSSNDGDEKEYSAEKGYQQQRRQPKQPEPPPLPQHQQKLQQKLTPYEQQMLSTGKSDSKSMGSVLHPDRCTPCSFFCYSLMGCNQGKQCKFCHEDHPKKNRRRGKKRHKGTSVAADADDCGAAAEDFHQVSPEVEARGVVPPDVYGEQDSDRMPEEAGKEERGQTWSRNQDIGASPAVDLDGAMRPAPTADSLAPLLEALDFLAPLPSHAPTAKQATLAHDANTDSWHEEKYHIPSSDSGMLPLQAAKLSLRYQYQ